MVATLLFFVIYLIVIYLIVSVGFVKQRSKEYRYATDETKIEAGQITVLIPFRNEEHRLDGLLNSISELKEQPNKFIFINDHSDDASIRVIRERLTIENYSILTLPDGVTGKKRALRFASGEIETKYTLTIDADVQFNSSYISALSQLGEADMYVLPVVMISKKWYEHFYEIDLLLVTAANSGLSGLSRPILASGANLLYKTDTFRKVDNLESHINMASGDDTYLLRDFRENNADVRLHSSRDCSVTTETPQSFHEFVDQRLRWIGKTGDIKDNLSTTLAVVQAILTIGFFGLLLCSLLEGHWEITALLFGLKSITDLFLFFAYFNRVKRLRSWVFIPIYELLFPIYTLLILVLLFTYTPKWKGRKIYAD